MTGGPLITHERLLELVEYDPATGMFYWRATGKVAGFNRDRGYRLLMLDKRKYPAQKVAWFYVKKEWPDRVVRFKNGDGQDCRITNLVYGQFQHNTRPGRRAYDRMDRERNPDKYRWSELRKNFGLSQERYQEMLSAQSGLCAGCGQPETLVRRGRLAWLSVDHNHITGEIRGLLCNGCNLAVGFSKENPEALRALAAYLERHQRQATKCDITQEEFDELMGEAEERRQEWLKRNKSPARVISLPRKESA